VSRANWAVREGEEKAGLGRAARGNEKGKREKKRWAGPKENKREKKKRILMHLNLNLKFKFKWKTNNKIMQYGMKCTKPIFPYISFLGLSNYYLIHGKCSKIKIME
jgi:hypothetical protein